MLYSFIFKMFEWKCAIKASMGVSLDNSIGYHILQPQEITFDSILSQWHSLKICHTLPNLISRLHFFFLDENLPKMTKISIAILYKRYFTDISESSVETLVRWQSGIIVTHWDIYWCPTPMWPCKNWSCTCSESDS